MLAPDGQKWLTKASRGPEHVFGRRSATQQIQRFAIQYPAKADPSDAIVQDFHTFRQALNVASAGQRVFVLVYAPSEKTDHLRQSLKPVANADEVVGRFHFDFETSSDWVEKIEGASDKPGIFIITPGEFGLKGKLLERIPIEASSATLTAALMRANQAYAKSTPKKVYSSHVAKGRREGVYFEGAVPYGEDRDGDGEIDRKRSGRRR
jgi:hypothetical protein